MTYFLQNVKGKYYELQILTLNLLLTMKKFKILAILLVALVTFNCSKDDDSPAPELTTHQLLMSGKWYVSSATHATLDSCQRESFYDFTHPETVIAEGFSTGEFGKCESHYLLVAKYVLIDDDQNIRLHIDEDELILSIEFISESKLVLQQDDTFTSFVKKN
ncbi:hypothetical protein [Gelidibacter sp.]|uniref:hypothetical protein n=1 Tax=Gelidibacter sp. TaxID=2018083 RepID=UPI002D7FD7FE|nr:hypothetical protein [Gelidibacter sp.]